MALASYSLSWLSVIIATVVAFLVGWLWYGPLFGKLWMKLNKIKQSDIKKAKQKGMAKMMILNLIGTLITAYVLAYLLLAVGASGINDALTLAFWIWLGFLLATTFLGATLWDNQPWGLFLLNGAYWLVVLEIMAIVISLF